MDEKKCCTIINNYGCCGCDDENGTGNGGTIVTDNAYSFEETVCGTWVDGKPIYRRVFEKSDFTSVSVNTVIGIAKDVDTMVDLYGKVSWFNNTSKYRVVRPLPFSSIANGTYADIMFGHDPGEIRIVMNIGDSKISPPETYKVYAVVEYTKLDDEVI